MNMPFWLLRLLPIWDYVCPKCQREVPRKSNRCPHCREQYGLPLRVPTHLLSDKEALVEYVHKHVFPIVNAETRFYLSQFFTVLFQDGFEGSLSTWTGGYTTGTATYAYSTEQFHHGSYSLKTVISAGEYSFLSKTLTGVAEVFCRYYVYLPNVPAVNAIFGQCRASGVDNWYVQARASGAISVYNYADTTAYDSATGLWSEDTWFCVEVRIVRHASAGIIQVWFNGTLVIDQSGLDTDVGATMTEFRIGSYYGSAGTTYMDCVVFADAAVGMQAGPSPAPPMTHVFDDGVESGDMLAYTITNIGGGCSLTVESDNPHHGTYNMEVYNPGLGASEWACGSRKIGTGYTTGFARCYVKFPAIIPGSAESGKPCLGFWVNATASNTARAGLAIDASGNFRWGMRYYNGGSFFNIYGSSTPAVDTWYYVELEVYIHASAGYAKLYVNGVLELSATGLNNSARQFAYVLVGSDQAWGAYRAFTMFVDCVVVDDAYIGPEISAKKLIPALGPRPLLTADLCPHLGGF